MDQTQKLQVQKHQLSEEIRQRQSQMIAFYQEELANADYLLIFETEQSKNHINLHKPREIKDIKERVHQLWQMLAEVYDRVQKEVETQSCRQILEVIGRSLDEIKSNVHQVQTLNQKLTKSVQITSSTSEFSAYALGAHLAQYGYGEIMEQALHSCDKAYRLPRNASQQEMMQMMKMMTGGWDGSNQESVNRLKAYGAIMRKELKPLMTKHAKKRADVIKQMRKACDWLENHLKKIAKHEQ